MLNKAPGVYLTEKTEEVRQTGNGKIPAFLFCTSDMDGHEGVDDIFKATSLTDLDEKIKKAHPSFDITKSTCYGVLEDFFNETKNLSNEEEGIDHFYFVDMGNGKNYTYWKNSLMELMAYPDISMIATYGIENMVGGVTQNMYAFLETMYVTFYRAQQHFDFRTGYFTVEKPQPETTYETNIDYYTSTIKGQTSDKTPTKNLLSSRIAYIEPKKYGVNLAKIAISPFWKDPGHNNYNSVSAGTFENRTDERILSLMNNGVIIGRDEKLGTKMNTRMNYAVSLAFASENNPADATLQSRFIIDAYYGELNEVLYPYVKSNEMENTLAYMKVDVDNLTDKWIKKGWLKPTSRCTVDPDDDNPYYTVVRSSLLPMNSIVAIETQTTIKNLRTYKKEKATA